jgi:hypothetical protein
MQAGGTGTANKVLQVETHLLMQIVRLVEVAVVAQLALMLVVLQLVVMVVQE